MKMNGFFQPLETHPRTFPVVGKRVRRISILGKGLIAACCAARRCGRRTTAETPRCRTESAAESAAKAPAEKPD